MYLTWLTLLLLAAEGWSQEDEDDGPYRGRLLGKLNSYHHQVTGEVYAVDEWTLLLVNFNYDGTGDDTFFWAGDSIRPGPQGFIVPDEHGKTNILERYYNAEVRISLPEGKRVSRLKWFAVYDIASQNAFGDVYVPDEFEAPAPRAAGALAGSGITSSPLQLLDANTILIPELHYDGSGVEVYFWAGAGPQPSARGFKIPDEYGYLEPLLPYRGSAVRLALPGAHSLFTVSWLALWDASARRALASVLLPERPNVPPALTKLHPHNLEPLPPYRGSAVRLALPGAHSLFTVSWLALWDASARRALASVLLPERPNVPPALTKLHPHKSQMPSCRQLHRDLQVAWEVFGHQLTFELAGKIGDDEYMAFGISGSESRSQMLGADVAVVSFDAAQQRGLATDYNITAKAPCVQVLGQWRGVCRDERLGALDSNQVFTASRTDGVTVVTYRRGLQPSEPIDREWSTEKPAFVVWAVGALDAAREPAFHRLWPRAVDVALNISQPAASDCVEFSVGSSSAPPAWETAELFDPALRVFEFRLGPAGGARGPAGRGTGDSGSGGGGGSGGGAPLAWYVNGQLAPDLQIRRGLHYTFKVFGGNNPHSADEYHPLIVTTEGRGGLERLPEAAQRAQRVLAGVHYTSGPAVPGGARAGRGPAARGGLRVLPRLQPQPRLDMRRRSPRRARRAAQRHLARPRLLQLLHSRGHGRAHLRGGPAAAQPQQEGQRRRGGRRQLGAAAGRHRHRHRHRQALADPLAQLFVHNIYSRVQYPREAQTTVHLRTPRTTNTRKKLRPLVIKYLLHISQIITITYRYPYDICKIICKLHFGYVRFHSIYFSPSIQ